MRLIGHKSTKNQIHTALKAAGKLNIAPPHMLFAGVAGCGKTSMARYIAMESGTDFIQVPASDLKEYKSVIEVLENLNHLGYDRMGNRIGNVKPTILFIDEIHRLPVAGQEPLGIAMEEFKMAAGRDGKCHWIPYFSLVGATTDDGSLSKPFRERFPMRFVFDTYSQEEISKIIGVHANVLNVEITPKAVKEIAIRGRGIPRIAVSYLKRARDLCLSRNGHMITHLMVFDTFKEMGIDEKGLTKTELKILKALFDSNIPIGLENLSVVVNESAKTLSASAEPFLIREGLIIRSGKGRLITKKGKNYLAEAGYSGKAHKIEIPAGYKRK
jgi:Holliday junction DNA helicase RuvB